MKLSYSDIRRFDDKLDSILLGQLAITAGQAVILKGVTDMTAAADRLTREVQETKDSNATLVGKIVDLIAAIGVLGQQIRDNASNEAAMMKTADEMDKLQKDNADFLAGLSTPPPPPTLDASYPDLAAFVAAASAYTGPEAVTLDGAPVTTAFVGVNSGAKDYFTHSADGHIDETGPTD